MSQSNTALIYTHDIHTAYTHNKNGFRNVWHLNLHTSGIHVFQFCSKMNEKTTTILTEANSVEKSQKLS